jgi:hypothetical protein
VREIFGNPFRPPPTTDNWPAAVSQLADAMYEGEPCHDVLRDALLDAGFPDLADHFAQPEQAHPKGCWVVDLILKKKDVPETFLFPFSRFK